MGIRGCLLALLFLAMVPLLAFRLLGLHDERERSIAAAHERALEFARLGAHRFDTTISEARTILDLIWQVPDVAWGTPTGCSTFLLPIQKERPWIGALLIINQKKQVSCSTMDDAVGFDVSERPWFLPATRSNTFTVSDFYVGKIRGKPATMALLPRVRADGTTHYVAANLDLEWFNRLVADIGSSADATVSLLDGSGTMMARHPEDPSIIGKNFANHPLAGRINGEMGAFEGTGFDGISRLYSFVRLPNANAYLMVGFARSSILAPINDRTRHGVILLITVGALALIAVIVLGRRTFLAPIESLTLASKRLAQGDFSARAAETAAAPEFRALTATFNRMAEVLQLRERELRAANAAIKAKESDLEAANARLRDIALVDALTGLANRRRFDEALNKIWDDARSSGEPVALLIVDVDHFKMFNDRYGHPAGDRCLRQVAEAIRTGCSRPGDLAARIGGEEFALLLPALPREQLKATAELVRTSVLDREIVREDTADGQVSVSVGVAYFYASGGWSADRLRIAADKALYQAKREGRNRVVIEADEAPTSALFRQAS